MFDFAVSRRRNDFRIFSFTLRAVSFASNFEEFNFADKLRDFALVAGVTIKGDENFSCAENTVLSLAVPFAKVSLAERSKDKLGLTDAINVSKLFLATLL